MRPTEAGVSLGKPGKVPALSAICESRPNLREAGVWPPLRGSHPVARVGTAPCIPGRPGPGLGLVLLPRPVCGDSASWACQMLLLQGDTGLQGPTWVGAP